MSKVFTYFIKTGEYYDIDGVWDGDYGDFFDYEVENEELLDVVVNLIYNDYFKRTDLILGCDYELAVKRGLMDYITSIDSLEELVECYEEELKEHFKEEALGDFC